MNTIIKYIKYVAFTLLTFCCQNNQWEQCQEEAEHSNRQCPKAIDPQTQLDSIKLNKYDKKLSYYYSLSGEPDSTFQAIIASMENKERILNALTNSYELRQYLQLNITFEYNYYSKLSGAHLGTIKITPNEYSTKTTNGSGS